MTDGPAPTTRAIRDALTETQVEGLRIVIEKLICEATIGVTQVERAQRQRLELGVELILRPAPPQHDDIAETVNYGTVVRTLRHLCHDSEYQLLETLAEALAGAFFVHDQVVATRVRIVKPDRYSDMEAIGIEIERRRANG
jgi:FolB domain-containing protein